MANFFKNNGSRKKKVIDLFFVLILIFILLLFSKLVIAANIDLCSGRFHLDMDERLSFDGIKKILHPCNFNGFLFQVFDGTYQFYGRIFWNLGALFSYLPEKLYLNTGQIIANRFLQYILILSSYFIIAFGLIRGWFLRILMLLIFLSVPYTSYFMTMPKPEPLQLLFISLFIYYYIKNKAIFSNYWIFLGLALGVKISTLPLIPFYFAISYFSIYKKIKFNHLINSISIISFPILIGLSISVPILIPTTALILLGIIFAKYIIKNYKSEKVKSYLFILSYTIFVFIYCYEKVFIWIQSTLFNTSHSVDKSNVDFIDWFKFLSNEWLVGPKLLNIFLIIILFFFAIYTLLKTNRRSVYTFKLNLPFTIFFSGVILNILICLFTKRLWGHYLYLGTTIIFIGLILIIEKYYFERKDIKLNKYDKISVFIVLLSILFYTTNYWIPNTYKDLNNYAHRTKKEVYKKDYKSYNIMNKYLKTLSDIKKTPINISIDPSLFQPNNTDHLIFSECFGKVNWEDSPDIIIFYPININQKEYLNHVISKSSYHSVIPPNYNKVKMLPNGSEILLRKKFEN